MMPLVDGCILWTGYYDKHGYAVGTLGGIRGKVTRLLWEKFKGPIPKGQFCCHKCDRPFCVNIDSCIFLGSVHDNIADKIAKSRHKGWKMPPESVMRGEKHPNSVLTEAIVTEAKAMRASGVMFKDIAKALNVNEETITGAVNGKHWAHLK